MVCVSHEQSTNPAALDIAAYRGRLAAFPTRVGDHSAVGDWIAQLSDSEVYLIVKRAEGMTLTAISLELVMSVDEVEEMWDRLKSQWSVLD